MNKQPLDRPEWDDYFMAMAMLAATRSPDAQWKAGTVIVNGDRHIIATGYNGFVPGLNDDKIPNIRPDKYNWVIHSEVAAILHATQSLKDCTLYTNGQPCLECFKKCVHVGIKEFVITKGKAHMCKEYTQEQAIMDEIMRQKKLVVRQIEFNDNILEKLGHIIQVSK